MERERIKEPEAIPNSDYDKTIRHYQEWIERQKSGQLLIRGEDCEFQQSRQGLIRYYLNAVFEHTALSSWGVFEHIIKRQSGRHRHQGGIIIYVLEGEGMTETDGKILDWREGDLLLLPVQPDGSVHQHWNKDASKGCRWVAFRDLLMARYIANAIDQVSDTPELRGATGSGPMGQRQGEWKASATTEQMPMVAHPDELNNLNLFDQLMGLRDLQRRRLEQATFLIRGSELPWEQNAHGKMQWYLHPALAYTAVQTHLFYRQEIPPGGRSGVQRHGGDAVFYILEGEGYTEVDGVRHAWKGGDVMTLPVFARGVVYRHVNTGAGRVRLIAIERNLVHTVGVDRQSGFEQLQPCPEYREAK
jgi:gentisate 1,2-dioxygenase